MNNYFNQEPEVISGETINDLKSSKEIYIQLSNDISKALHHPFGSLKMINQSLIHTLRSEGLKKEIIDMALYIHKQTEESSLAMENITYLSRLKVTGNPISRKNLVHINGIISNLVDNYQLIAELKEVKIRQQLIHNLVGKVDIDILKLIIKNLLHNAIKYSPEGKTVILSSEFVGENEILFTIQDEGAGIPDQLKEQIISPVRFTTDGTHDENGLGIGLKVCHSLISNLNGKLWFKTEKGKGSSFYFTIEVIDPSA